MIKSYTEDDVQKSLKYEIWSSTDPGNKRLDKAFKETAGRGPIYLFFSVNARYLFLLLASVFVVLIVVQWALLRYGRNVDPRGLHTEQHCLGFGQVEGRVQSQMDFRARYPKCQPASHTLEVRSFRFCRILC